MLTGKMTETFTKFSIVILLLTLNIHITCAEETYEQVHQEISKTKESVKNHVDQVEKTGIAQINLEKSEQCDKEGDCDKEASEGSSSAESEINPDTQNEESQIKTEEVLDKVNQDEKVSAEGNNIDKEKGNNEKTNVGQSDESGVDGVEKEADAAVDEAKSENDKKLVDDTREVNTDASIDNSTAESNSTLYHWLKFLFDPILDEFRDGIYQKISDKTNSTESNVSNVHVHENVTVEIETVNVTVTDDSSNITENENVTDTGKKVKFECSGKNVTDSVNATVKLITTAQLLQMLNFEKNDTENVTDCLLVMFYAPWCHFCAKIAPYYNALARAFPQLDFVAVDTAQFSNLLARFGTVSVPNILVFHQSRAAVKFNQTERTFENLITFVTNSTGLEANSTVNVTETDYQGPVPSVPTTEPDYLLLVSWIFVIFCSTCMFVKSNKGQQWINKVRILWQEHQHID